MGTPLRNSVSNCAVPLSSNRCPNKVGNPHCDPTEFRNRDVTPRPGGRGAGTTPNPRCASVFTFLRPSAAPRGQREHPGPGRLSLRNHRYGRGRGGRGCGGRDRPRSPGGGERGNGTSRLRSPDRARTRPGMRMRNARCSEETLWSDSSVVS